MSITIGHASIDERGKASGGTAGDQTAKELCTRTWYNKPWHTVLRPKYSTVAKGIKKACKAGCANPNIGYDQTQRTTLYDQAMRAEWDLSKIKTKCETDCSAFVAVCVNAAGVAVSKDMYTGNMVAALKGTEAFDVLTSSQYLTSDQYLKAGDILVGNGHTAMVLENGAKVPAKPDAKKHTIPKHYIRSGDKGTKVKRLQDCINDIITKKKLGTTKLTEDGDFGAKTKAALIVVQKALKVEKPNGTYGPKSEAAFEKALGGK